LQQETEYKTKDKRQKIKESKGTRYKKVKAKDISSFNFQIFKSPNFQIES